MTSVKIHKTHTKEGVVYYELLVKSGVREWTCLRRYNDFDALHEHLVKDHSVARDKLPKKKVTQFDEIRSFQNFYKLFMDFRF